MKDGSPQPRKFADSQGKMVAKSTPAGQFTGQRIIGELQLRKNRSKTKKSRRATSGLSPLKFSDVTSLITARIHKSLDEA